MDRMCPDVSVLYEDDSIAVVTKPCGVLSEAHERLPNLPALLRDRCGCEVYPVHRLDKTTEGLMVYAKTGEAAAKLSEEIRLGRMEKIYLAVVEGIPDERGEMTDLLYFDRAKGKSYVVRRERKGVKLAKLSYERLSIDEIDGAAVSTVRIRLSTGRTHQIRVQFASRKMPLVGDRRYGSRIPSDRIALCAAQLRFRHPITGEELDYDITPSHTNPG